MTALLTLTALPSTSPAAKPEDKEFYYADSPRYPRTAHAGKSLQYYTVDTGVGYLLRTGRDDRRGNNGTLYRYVANQCRAGRSRHTGILGCYAHKLEGCNSVLGIMLLVGLLLAGNMVALSGVQAPPALLTLMKGAAGLVLISYLIVLHYLFAALQNIM